MGFTLEFSEKDDILVRLPKEKLKENWELTKKIIDMYFEEPMVADKPKTNGCVEKEGDSSK